MFAENADRILARLRPGDRVLDIGGWARPFNRADHVLDQEPYETRGYYGLPAQGGEAERFTRETWVRRDICSREPFPFGDKELDFVICSHTLEDIRDPLWVCSEMVRIAKAGYLEIPSRAAETSRGVEPGQAGWSHHRWLIDIEGDHVRFMMKYHKIHSHWRLSFPRRFLRRMPERSQVQWLFWEGSFRFSEVTIHGVDAMEAELERYVQATRPYPGPLLAADRAWRRARTLPRRAVDRLKRELRKR
jgi:SAM-dependent methyltransferase